MARLASPQREGLESPVTSKEPRRVSAALQVALGISASRLAGLGRETVAARLLGNSPAGDAFAVAMRIPNMLQSLLGEGVLSASFVPVYSQLLDEEADDDPENPYRCDPTETAGAVAAALTAVVGVSLLVIITSARPITFLLAPGLSDQRFELAVTLVRITALGAGFAVLSAWCLGVLNSHRRFFLSYAAPVLWNAVQVGALLVAWILAFDLDDIARALAWGVAGGGLAQLLVQLPVALRLVRGLTLRWRRNRRSHQALLEVRRRFAPAVLGRGVVQVSAYLDLVLASLLATGAVAALYRAQLLYMLPVSLCAMSVAAAELPEMSRLSDDPKARFGRTSTATRRVAFWMMLAASLYAAAGDLAVGVLFEGGEFGSDDTVLVWLVLAAYATGLPATGVSRVHQNACYAQGDTAGPARIAALRVMLSGAIAVAVMFPLDRVMVGPDGLLGAAEALRPAWALPPAERELHETVRLGAVGLALGSAVASWVELTLLSRRVMKPAAVRAALARTAPAGALAFLTAAALKMVTSDWHVLLSAPVVAACATVVYTLAAHRSGVGEAQLLLGPVRRLIWRNQGPSNQA